MYAPAKANIALMHKTIDKILAELMTRAGINQAELSRLSGVGQPTISRILKPNGPKGIKEPADKQVRPLAEHFGVSTDQLRGFVPLDGAEAVTEKRDRKTSAAEMVRQMLATQGKGLSEDARRRLLATDRKSVV